MMKNNINDFYENAIEKWRISAGVGTIMLDKSTDYRPIVLGVIQRIYNRSPTIESTIIVKDFNERTNIIQYLTNTDDAENNKEIKELIKKRNITVITADFLAKHFVSKSSLCILVGTDSVCRNSLGYLGDSKFKLTILFNYLENSEYRVWLYKICPILSEFTQQEIQQLRLTHPVEETFIGVDVKDVDTIKTLEGCDKFITQSFNIFGNFDNALKARMGDKSLNISAMQICQRIAEENGWNDSLDMNIPINVSIDKMYNPNALYERSSQLSSIIKERSKILSDYEGKLEKIAELVNKHIDSKIFIINKRGEFANKVTDYLNNVIEKFGTVCGNCHDKSEPVYAYDSNGVPIRYKSGVSKGKIKELKAKAQYSMNVTDFNIHNLNVLSFSNSPDKNTQATVDVIIITSPACDTIEEYIYRLSKVKLRSNPLIVYTIYCKSTIEEKQLQSKQPSSTHLIVNKSEIVTDFDKNSGIYFVE